MELHLSFKGGSINNDMGTKAIKHGLTWVILTIATLKYASDHLNNNEST
jgi:hypothetical protein